MRVNGYYDFNYFNGITPYLSAGVGMSHNNSGKFEVITEDVSTIYNKKATNNLAWQLGAGTAVKINDSLDLDLSYKFINLGKIKTTSGVGTLNLDQSTRSARPAQATLKAQELTTGIRFNF